MFAPKLKFLPDPIMGKSLSENNPDPFVQGHRRSPGVFMNFLNYFEVKQNIIRCGGEEEQLWVNVEYTWGTSLHDGVVEKSLRIKTPQWRRGGVLEEQAPLMEDMGGYFRK